MSELVRPGDHRVVPWKNGRGTTREVLARREGDLVLWRVSVATVPEDGPFSDFPGMDRVILVLRGAGMVLRTGDGPEVTVPPWVPHRFPGDLPTTCRLVDGPVEDWNLMWRPSAWSATVEVRKAGPVAAPPGGLCVVAVAEGRCIGGGRVAEGGDTLLIDEGMAEIQGRAVVALLWPPAALAPSPRSPR